MKSYLKFGLICSIAIFILELIFGSLYTIMQGLFILLMGFIIGLFLNMLFTEDKESKYKNFSDLKKTFTLGGTILLIQFLSFILQWNVPLEDVSSPIIPTIIASPISNLYWIFTQMGNIPTTSYIIYLLLIALCFIIYAALLFVACFLEIKIFKNIEKKKTLYGLIFIIFILILITILTFFTSYLIGIL